MTALRSLLDRDKDADIPNLNVLLCETYTAVYLSLLVYGLATCDTHILFRLVTQRPTGQVAPLDVCICAGIHRVFVQGFILYLCRDSSLYLCRCHLCICQVWAQIFGGGTKKVLTGEGGPPTVLYVYTYSLEFIVVSV